MPLYGATLKQQIIQCNRRKAAMKQTTLYTIITHALLGPLQPSNGKINEKNINDIPLYMKESIDNRR
jgi:hypothetical protein